MRHVCNLERRQKGPFTKVVNFYGKRLRLILVSEDASRMGFFKLESLSKKNEAPKGSPSNWVYIKMSTLRCLINREVAINVVGGQTF